MKIAILGWGSLMWDQRLEFDNYHTEWHKCGPHLKLEFSRISETRKGALTLVIDEAHGTELPTQYTLSRRKYPDDAICDLRSREGTVLKRIGYYFADGSREGTPDTPDNIKQWIGEKKYDVVVWTGLESNFNKKLKENFSVKNALRYLQDPDFKGRHEAAKYISRAPSCITTPFRTAIQNETWFQNWQKKNI